MKFALIIIAIVFILVAICTFILFALSSKNSIETIITKKNENEVCYNSLYSDNLFSKIESDSKIAGKENSQFLEGDTLDTVTNGAQFIKSKWIKIEGIK